MRSLPDIVLPQVRHFGLSIDKTSIRGIEIDTKGQVRRTGEVVLSEDVFDSSVLSKADVFIEALKKLHAEGGFSSPYAIVCFPEAFAYSRTLTLPIIDNDEVQEAVSWRIKELFPFPEQDLYFDWKILTKTDSELNLAVVAVQKRILDPILSSLSSARIKPLRFEPAGLAIARLLVVPAGTHTLVTEINKNVAYVTLVEGQNALFTTLVTLHKDESVEHFIQGINRTLEEITSYYLAKGVLKDGEITVTLTGEVVSQDWIAHIKYPSKILTTEVGSPSYNKAYAAARATVAPPSDPDSINLLPSAVQNYYDTERNTQFYKTMLLRFSVIAGVFAFFAGSVYTLMHLEQQRLATQVERLTMFTQSQPSSLKSLLRLNSQAQDIVALAPLRLTAREKIMTILSIAPESITIQQWEYDDKKLQFKLIGVAQTRESLLDFRDKLENSGEFTKITVPLGTLETPINVQFELTFISAS